MTIPTSTLLANNSEHSSTPFCSEALVANMDSTATTFPETKLSGEAYDAALKTFMRNPAIYQSIFMAQALIEEFVAQGVPSEKATLKKVFLNLEGFLDSSKLKKIARNVSLRLVLKIQDTYELNEINELNKAIKFFGVQEDELLLILKNWRDESLLDPNLEELESMIEFILKNQAAWPLKLLDAYFKQARSAFKIKFIHWSPSFQRARWFLDMSQKKDSEFYKFESRFLRIIRKAKSYRLQCLFSRWIKNPYLRNAIHDHNQELPKSGNTLSFELEKIEAKLIRYDKVNRLSPIVDSFNFISKNDFNNLLAKLRVDTPDENDLANNNEVLNLQRIENDLNSDDPQIRLKGVEELKTWATPTCCYSERIRMGMLKILFANPLPKKGTSTSNLNSHGIYHLLIFLMQNVLYYPVHPGPEIREKFLSFILEKKVILQIESFSRIKTYESGAIPRYLHETVETFIRHLVTKLNNVDSLENAVSLYRNAKSSTTMTSLKLALNEDPNLAKKVIFQEAFSKANESRESSSTHEIVSTKIESETPLEYLSAVFKEAVKTHGDKELKDVALPLEINILFLSVQKIRLQKIDLIHEGELLNKLEIVTKSIFESLKDKNPYPEELISIVTHTLLKSLEQKFNQEKIRIAVGQT